MKRKKRPPRGVNFYRYFYLQKGACLLCGRPLHKTWGENDMATTWDHIIPRAAGGRDALGNLALAHRLCNVRRGHRRPPNWYVKAGVEFRRKLGTTKVADAESFWENSTRRATSEN